MMDTYYQNIPVSMVGKAHFLFDNYT